LKKANQIRLVEEYLGFRARKDIKLKLRTIIAVIVFSLGSVPLRAQFGGFGGPSILSTGTGRVGAAGGRPMQASWFANLSGSYFSDLTPVEEEADGVISAFNQYGLWGTLGVRVNRVRARSATSFAGTAGYGYMKQSSSIGGLQGTFELSDSRQTSRRFAWHNSLAGFTTNFAGTGYYYFSELPTAQLANPAGEIFDNRVYMVSGATGFTYNHSARWAFTGQAGVFVTTRRKSTLADVRGVLGRGSAAYSLSRRTSVGTAYSYNYFFFPHGFGEVRVQTLMGTFSRQLDRRWTIHLAAGPLQTSGERLQTVTLDPIIAQLTGQTSGIEVYKGSTSTWAAQGSLIGRFQRSSLNFDYFRGVIPGNGLYISSFSEYLSGGYNIPRGRDWTFGVNGGYNRMKPLTQTILPTKFYSINGVVGYRLAEHLALSFSAGIWRTDAFENRLARNRLALTLGLTYTSNEMPYKIF
jgi:hypothetical protein